MVNSHRPRRRTWAAGAAAVVLVLTACGGDDDDAASSATAEPTESAPAATDVPDTTSAPAVTEPSVESTSAPAESTSAPAESSETSATASSEEAPTPASGEPYIVYVIATSTVPDLTDGYQAIQEGLNARGGINGRPVELRFCFDEYDPNAGTKCGQQAVDEGALAVVGASGSSGSQRPQVLNDAKIASIADQYLSSDVFTAPGSFPFTPGPFVPVAGAAAGVEYFETPQVIVSTIDVPAGRGYPPLIGSVVAPVGGEVTTEVYIPISATDLAPYAAQIVGQPGVLSEGNTVDIGIRLGLQLQQQGFDQPVIYNPTTWDVATIVDNFGEVDNAYLASALDLESEGYRQFDADLDEYAPDFAPRTGSLVLGWAGLNVLANVAPEIGEGDLTAEMVYDYFSAATAVETFGLTPPLDFTTPNESMGGAIPRAFNDLVALYHLENGEWVRVTEFTDYLA